MPTQNQIRESINQQILEHLQIGNIAPWRRPWSLDRACGAPCNVVSGNNYRGINPAILDVSSMKHGFESKWWGTFRQWKELGGSVVRRPDNIKPGKWGTTIVFWKAVAKSDKETESNKKEGYCFMKTYTVFNIDQVEGSHLDHLRVGHGQLEPNEVQERFDRAEKAIEATGADIRYFGNEAFYSPASDSITLPHRQNFSVPGFYETAFHELSHWTEHHSRLNWDRSNPEHTIALGELIAELGGCYMAAELGVPTAERLENHASYLKSWLRDMQDDHKFIFRAAAQAARAADYVLAFSREPVEETETAPA